MEFENALFMEEEDEEEQLITMGEMCAETMNLAHEPQESTTSIDHTETSSYHYEMWPQCTSQHFMIKNDRLNLVIGLSNALLAHQGADVVLVKRTGAATQLWVEDYRTSTIRPKLNVSLCLETDDSRTTLKPYCSGNQGQKWRRDGARLVRPADPGVVLDIAGRGTGAGASIHQWRRIASVLLNWNQLWTYEYVASGTLSSNLGMHFYIWSVSNGHAITVGGEGDKQRMRGARVVTAARKSPPETCDDQLWYMDECGVLRSKLTGFALQAGDSSGTVVLHPYDAERKTLQWGVNGGRIINRELQDNLVLELCANAVHVTQDRRHPTQRWKFDYVIS